MYKIAITGSTGLVGSRIIELLQENMEFIEIKQEDCDITDRQQVQRALKDINFDYLLHLAAYTAVDKGETESDIVRKINVDGTKHLFEASQDKKAKFIYISTEYVFDGNNPPYYEDSSPNPLSIYGKTKYEGENIVKDEGMIVRISFPYRKNFEQKKDFVRVIKGLLEQGKQLKMITDCSTTPTFIDDIAYALKHLIHNYSPEIFHINGTQSQSPYEQGLLIAKTFGIDPGLISTTTFDEYYAGKAPRPRYAEMKNKKNNFYKMKSFEEGLQSLQS